MSTETQLRKPFITALRKSGAIVVPYVGSSMGQMGVSDVFVAHIGWHGWIEFKGPTTKIEPIQKQFILDMRKRKVNAVIIRLFDDVAFTIDEMTAIKYYVTGYSILGALKDHDCLQLRSI